MKKLLLLTLILALPGLWANEYSLELTAQKNFYQVDESIVLSIKDDIAIKDQLWDTYLYFTTSNQTPIYVTCRENTLAPTSLQMLPKQIQLQPQNWHKDELVKLHLVVCKYQTQEIMAQASLQLHIAGSAPANTNLPVSGQLKFIEEKADFPAISFNRYTDYKQFDSRWKNDYLGFSTRTLGQAGCAISAAANIISWTPRKINGYLKDNGGYANKNLIIWGKVPYIRVKGYVPMSNLTDSAFNSYHIIAHLGGHFVLLTGPAGGGKYRSHDPGKSYNPTFSKNQIRDVLFYYK